MRLAWLAVLSLAACRGTSTQPRPDWLLVPGQRAGGVTAGTSLADLQRIYGRAVQAQSIALGEGESAPGAILFPDDSSRRLELVWRDASARAPRSVTISGRSSAWHTAEGVTLGTSLAALERLNGGPFRLTGFGWDYSGTVLDWRGGALDGRFGRSLLLRLSPPTPSESTAAAVQGDSLFSSAYGPMRAVGPRVYQIVLTFDSTPAQP